MLLYKRMALVLVIFIGLTIIILGSTYRYMISPMSNNKDIKLVEIKEGSNVTTIASTLKSKHLIRNTNIFKLYIKMNSINNLKAGYYNLSENMNIKTIVSIINQGKGINPNSINITFPEGKNMRQIASIIAGNTNNTSNDVFNLLKDTKYIDSLIKKYWFLTNEIKNKNIYYPLEGYLFPNTYNFDNKSVKVEEIFTTMLTETDKILTKYKNEIEKKDFTVHEFLTLASIVEDEGVNDQDRPTIAGVFYNRLEQKIPFGSCVTACYATKTDPCTPKKVDTDANSPYNTYLSSMAGKLPVGPVSNPGEASIKAAIMPTENNYLFFLADKYKRTYFSRTNAEHVAKIAELKAEHLWIEE